MMLESRDWKPHSLSSLYRNVILKMSILGILCYYWMSDVAQKFSVCFRGFNTSQNANNCFISTYI